ncbi:MAG TPA: 50S ribosomal protein L29 [Gemmatimonadales bacterium]|jgi:large subunit ribosomal protein L29|nr:50S ribosomal protein L29 [Gemmatimonadales bacterium]
MARQRPDDLRQLKTDELQHKLGVLREERFRLRFRTGTEALPNPLQFRTIRRDIARIETILRERGGRQA